MNEVCKVSFLGGEIKCPFHVQGACLLLDNAGVRPRQDHLEEDLGNLPEAKKGEIQTNLDSKIFENCVQRAIISAAISSK